MSGERLELHGNDIVKRVLRDEKRFALCSLAMGATLFAGTYALGVTLQGCCGLVGMPSEEARQLWGGTGMVRDVLNLGVYPATAIFSLVNAAYFIRGEYKRREKGWFAEEYIR